MTWPTSIVIDTVFVPLYAILLVLNVPNVIKHGHQRAAGFISLLIFSILHLVGNIMLVVEYNQHYTSINVAVWGYILQSIGLSFLVSASLGFYTRAKSQHSDESPSSPSFRTTKFVNLINLGALICIITGYSTVDFTNAQGDVINPDLPVETKVGAVLYIFLVLAILFLALATLPSPSKLGREERLIKLAILLATPFMLVRAAYAVYTTFSSSILLPKNIWVKFILQYLSEFLVITIYTALGYRIDKLHKPEYALDEERASSNVLNEAKWSSSQNSSDVSQQIPLSYNVRH